MQFTKDEQATINKAIQILESKVLSTDFITSSSKAVEIFRLKLSSKTYEVFAVMFLTTRNQVIEVTEMFNGTIDAASVYPREVAKRALEVNAASIIMAHNHPSDNAEPSNSDIVLTNRLASALGLLDITVIDHIIVTKNDYCSFAERGLL